MPASCRSRLLEPRCERPPAPGLFSIAVPELRRLGPRPNLPSRPRRIAESLHERRQLGIGQRGVMLRPRLRRQRIAKHVERGRVCAGVKLVSERPCKDGLEPAAEPRARLWRLAPYRQQRLEHERGVDLLQGQAAERRAGQLERRAPLLPVLVIGELLNWCRSRETARRLGQR